MGTEVTRTNQAPLHASILGRPLHEQAVNFGQAILDLQNDAARHRYQVEEWYRYAHLLEGEVQQLKAQLADMTEKKDYYQRRANIIMSKLETSSQIIMDALQEQSEDPYKDAPAGPPIVDPQKPADPKITPTQELPPAPQLRDGKVVNE